MFVDKDAHTREAIKKQTLKGIIIIIITQYPIIYKGNLTATAFVLEATLLIYSPAIFKKKYFHHKLVQLGYP